MRPNELNFAHNKCNYTNSHFYDVLSNKLQFLQCFVQSQIKTHVKSLSNVAIKKDEKSQGISFTEGIMKWSEI